MGNFINSCNSVLELMYKSKSDMAKKRFTVKQRYIKNSEQ